MYTSNRNEQDIQSDLKPQIIVTVIDVSYIRFYR